MKLRRRLILAFALLVVLFLVLPIASPELALLISRLPFAWVDYLWRTLPNVTFNWIGIGMVLLCSALALTIGHSLYRWLYNHIVANAGTKGVPGVWPRRWTFALYGGFWLLFTIVMGASGLARTTTWYFQLNQPFYRTRSHDYVDMKTIEGMLATAVLETKGDVTKMQAWMLEYDQDYRPPSWERHHILLFADPNNVFKAAIFYPRDAEGQRRIGFWVYGGPDKEYTMDQLSNVVSRLEAMAKEASKGSKSKIAVSEPEIPNGHAGEDHSRENISQHRFRERR